MTGPGWVAFCMAVAAVFNVEPVPLPSPESPVFVANAGPGCTPGVVVLGPEQASVYAGAPGATPVTVPLPLGTPAVDIADIDGDGQPELVAICGDGVFRCGLAPGAPQQPVELFRLHTQLAAPAPLPAPYVLAVKAEGRVLLALPCENTFELRDPGGALVSSFPIGPDAPHRVSYGTPLQSRAITPPEAGGPGALEVDVSRILGVKPELPESLSVSLHDAAFGRDEMDRTRLDRSPGDELWPWLPLQAGGARTQRVLYRDAGPGSNATLVRIRRAAPGPGGISERDVTIGPPRRYPGSLMVPEDDLPDFNGDGYTDLLLWTTPEPAASVDSLMRLVTGGQWPVQLRAHLFVPNKDRFEPVPAAVVNVEAPTQWFAAPEATGPLRHVVLRDFDGDGQTDLGCCVAPRRFCAWLWRAGTFAGSPGFAMEFAQPVTGVAFRADMDGHGRTSIGLRTEDTLYVLRAQAPASGQ